MGATVLALLTGCGPSASDPVRTMALVLDADRTYRPREVQLETLTDPVALSGSVAVTRGGARIVEDPSDVLLQNAKTPEDIKAALIKSRGLPPRVNYIEREGVLWPADFHSWNLVTGYYALERAQRYFQANGGPTAEAMGPLDFYYFPDLVLKSVSADPLKNNAIYFSPIQGMLLLPFDEDLQEAPLAINTGVLAHEWAHRVFNHSVHGGSQFPEPIARWVNSTAPAVKLLFALDEGLADFHAVAASCAEASGCDPTFLDTSFDEAFSNRRDLSRKDLCLTRPLLDALDSQSLGEFRAAGLEYTLGTIIASTLYQAAESSGLREDLQRAIIAAYSDDASSSPGYRQIFTQNLTTEGNITLPLLMSAIINHAEAPALKTALCNEAIDRLKIPAELMDGCVGATGGTHCPPLEGSGG